MDNKAERIIARRQRIEKRKQAEIKRERDKQETSEWNKYITQKLLALDFLEALIGIYLEFAKQRDFEGFKLGRGFDVLPRKRAYVGLGTQQLVLCVNGKVYSKYRHQPRLVDLVREGDGYIAAVFVALLRMMPSDHQPVRQFLDQHRDELAEHGLYDEHVKDKLRRLQRT